MAVHRAPRCNSFSITVNNYTEQDRLALLDLRCADYIIVGREVGPENDQIHLQAFAHYKNKRTSNDIKAAVPTAHVEPATGSTAQNKEYCGKEGDFEERGVAPPLPQQEGPRNPITDMLTMAVAGSSEMDIIEVHGGNYAVHRQLIRECADGVLLETNLKRMKEEWGDDSELRDWQNEAYLHLLAQNDRQILFVIGEGGNEGKSWLADWLVIMKGAIKYNTTTRVDCAYAYKDQKIVVFDLMRHGIEQLDYGTLEMFKGRTLLFPSKYDSMMKSLFDVKVIAFMNTYPHKQQLCKDRYNIYCISTETFIGDWGLL